MPPAFPPLAALFLTHFHDHTGQEVVYYVSLSDETLPPSLIEHLSLPSGMHLRSEDVVAFTHHGLHGAGLFRSRDKEGGRGRRMGTLGVVLAPPSSPDTLFDLASLLADVYDQLEGIEDPFAPDGVSASARKAALDGVWAAHRAANLEGVQVHSAKTVAVRLSRGVSTAHPVTYLPALLGMLGPALITVYKASLSGRRILLYAPPPLLPLEAFAWCVWAMGLPPGSATAGGARASTWLGQVGLMQLDDVKARTGGWVATTSDLVYKSHTDVYDLLVDFSDSISSEAGDDVRAPRRKPPATPKLFATDAGTPGTNGKPTVKEVTYAFRDMTLYRSLVLLDESPHSVHAETVGFSATSRTGGMWLFMFEVLERLYNLCVGVCEFAIGRGRVGSGPIALEDGDEDAHLLRAEMSNLAAIEEEEAEDSDDEDGDGANGGSHTRGNTVPDESARRGRLILDQLHHNAHHLYARLIQIAAGTWELSDDNLRTLTGTNRLTWSGRQSSECKFWLALARTWNVEPAVGSEDHGEGAQAQGAQGP